MTFIVPHKLKCPQRRQRGHDLSATTAIAAQGICWIARLSVLMWVKVPSAFNGETSYKPTSGPRRRQSVLSHNFRVACCPGRKWVANLLQPFEAPSGVYS